jgi:hypothetical protein
MGTSIAAVRYHHVINKLRIFFLMAVTRGSSEAIAQLSAEICCISCVFFLKNMERALCVWLEDKTQMLLLVGSIEKKMAMSVKASMRYVSEDEESSTYGPPSFW